MRKILITLGVLVAFVIGIVASWIFAGRQISLFLDRFGTIEMTSARINSIVYEGRGTGGILHVNDLALSLNDRNGPSPNIGTTKNGQLGLADGAVMETPFVLRASLEKNYRRDTRYDLALRAILLRATAHSRQRGLGKWIHDTRRLNRSDPGYYQGVTASRTSPLFRQLPSCRSLGRPCLSRTSLHRYWVRLSRKFQKLFSLDAGQSLWEHVCRSTHPVSARRILGTIDRTELERLRDSYPYRPNARKINAYEDAKYWIGVNVRRAQDLWLDRSPPLQILDLGCGAGYFLYLCRLFGHEGLGFDTDEEPAAARSWKKIRSRNRPPRLLSPARTYQKRRVARMDTRRLGIFYQRYPNTISQTRRASFAGI